MDGQWIKQERTKRGMRQCDLAARLGRGDRSGINQGRIPEWENNKKPVPADIEAQLIALFGHPTSEAA